MYTDSLISLALAVSIIYFLVKFFELRFQNEEEKKPLKSILKDSIFVFISTMIGVTIINQFSPMKGGSSNPSAFIDTPEF